MCDENTCFENEMIWKKKAVISLSLSLCVDIKSISLTYYSLVCCGSGDTINITMTNALKEEACPGANLWHMYFDEDPVAISCF